MDAPVSQAAPTPPPMDFINGASDDEVPFWVNENHTKCTEFFAAQTVVAIAIFIVTQLSQSLIFVAIVGRGH
jgi:hypothetical protein